MLHCFHVPDHKDYDYDYDDDDDHHHHDGMTGGDKSKVQERRLQY